MSDTLTFLHHLKNTRALLSQLTVISPSVIQRRYRILYVTAVRIIEELQREGRVGLDWHAGKGGYEVIQKKETTDEAV